MKRTLVSLAAALALSACASAPTVYQPATGPSAVGFSAYKIEPGRYRITFHGGPGAPPEQVSDYALLRAADLALAQGYDWFRVTERSTHPDGGGHSTLSLGIGGGDYGWRSGVGVGVGTSVPLGGGPALVSTLEVMMGNGARPSSDPDVYDARGVRATVGPRT